MTAIARLPSPEYIIARCLGARAPNPLAVDIVAALQGSGWRLVPGRSPSPRSNENSQIVMTEGAITTQQLIDMADWFR